VTILPEAPDFIGANDGVVFMRQPQIRYNTGNGWTFSIERPETTVTPYQGGNSRVTTGDSAMPDLTARYQNRFDNIHYSIAALVRQLEYRDTAAGIDDTEIAWGVNLTSKIDIGQHDVRLGLVHGTGLGRYVGINSTNDAVAVPMASGSSFDLDAIEVTGFSAAYRHVWTEQYRTSFIVTRAELNNKEQLAGLGANDSTQRIAANLMYDANEALTIGFEVSRGTREILSGDKGHINRAQVSVRYGF